MKLEEVAITEEDFKKDLSRNFSAIVFKNEVSDGEMDDIVTAFKKIGKTVLVL